MEQNPNPPQNQSIDQVVRRISSRAYFDPFESQTHSSVSAPLYDNVSFRIEAHIFQSLPTFYEDLMKSCTNL